MGDLHKVHLFAAWGEKSDSVVQAPFELDGKTYWEDLTANRLSEQRYGICCIPFFVYDVALGDEVDVLESPGGALFSHVSLRSGYVVYRMWLRELNQMSVRSLLDSLASEVLDPFSCTFEQYSHRLLGVAAPSVRAAERLVVWLQAREGVLEWESGQS